MLLRMIDNPSHFHTEGVLGVWVMHQSVKLIDNFTRLTHVPLLASVRILCLSFAHRSNRVRCALHTDCPYGARVWAIRSVKQK